MGLLQEFQKLIAEPPPDFAFEISEHGLAWCTPRTPAAPGIEQLPEKGLTASPSSPNVVRPHLFREALMRIAGEPGPRRTAALVIPDYAVRMAVLEFQQFPTAEEERTALLRFRLRKSVPFHIDEANVAYSIQIDEPQHTEVLAVAIARPILNEYELFFQDHGFRVGLVTPSLLAAAPLFNDSNDGLSLVMKVAGSAVSVLLIHRGLIRLVRTIDLGATSPAPAVDADTRVEELLALVQQMTAYSEDQIGMPIRRVLVCGMQSSLEMSAISRELGLEVEPVRGRFGPASEFSTGLLGLLEQYLS